MKLFIVFKDQQLHIERNLDCHNFLSTVSKSFDICVSHIRQYLLNDLQWPLRKYIFHGRNLDWLMFLFVLGIVRFSRVYLNAYAQPSRVIELWYHCPVYLRPHRAHMFLLCLDYYAPLYFPFALTYFALLYFCTFINRSI